MLEPLKQFICDTCNLVIDKPEDGWVEWIGKVGTEKMVETNFRICHHNNRCTKHSNHPDCSDNHLEHVLEWKLPFLYDMLATSEIPDMKAYVTFMRRLTIPYYEEARQYWREAKEQEIVSNRDDEMSNYSEGTLKRVIENGTGEEFED